MSSLVVELITVGRLRDLFAQQPQSRFFVHLTPSCMSDFFLVLPFLGYSYRDYKDWLKKCSSLDTKKDIVEVLAIQSSEAKCRVSRFKENNWSELSVLVLTNPNKNYTLELLNNEYSVAVMILPLEIPVLAKVS